METVVLNVEGMSCNHCVQTIINSLHAINGIDRVNVDLKGKKVEVELDPQVVSIETIKLTIEDRGYRVV